MIMKEFYNFEEIDIDKIEDYSTKGVWALFGIKKTDSEKKYVCLNVGKSVCIKDELKTDIKRIRNFELSREKEYRNQFNECMFSYFEFATRLDWLYREIALKYENFKFIIVCNDSEYLIEKYFAYTLKAKYWVSNGRYSSSKIINENEISRIRKDVRGEILQNYELLIEKIDNLKVELEKQ